MGRFAGLLGILTFLGLAYLFSTNRKAIRLKTVLRRGTRALGERHSCSQAFYAEITPIVRSHVSTRSGHLVIGKHRGRGAVLFLSRKRVVLAKDLFERLLDLQSRYAVPPGTPFVCRCIQRMPQHDTAVRGGRQDPAEGVA